MMPKGTHRLHDVLESIQSNVASSGSHLCVESHTETLHEGREDERPFPADKRKRNREKGKNRSDDTWEVDVDVLSVCLCDRVGARRDVELKEHERKVGSCQVE